MSETNLGRDQDEDDGAAPLPANTKNYMTPSGYARLKAEALQLIDHERPALVQVVHWAAANGDRSENGDYIYGKRRLREIDRRIRFLTKRLEFAEVVDPAARSGTEQIFFGATVTVVDQQGNENTYVIVGIDEADVARGRISWISPLARALLKHRAGDEITLATPSGEQRLEILEVRYQALRD